MGKMKEQVISHAEEGMYWEEDYNPTPSAPPTKRKRIRDWFLDALGREKPDPVPMAPPVGYIKEVSLTDRVRDMVRSEHLRLRALQSGQETFEDADDFDVGDDFDPAAPYEEVFDPIEADARQQLREDDYRAMVRRRAEQIRPPKPEVTNEHEGSRSRRSATAEGGSTNPDPQSDGKPGSSKEPASQ